MKIRFCIIDGKVWDDFAGDTILLESLPDIASDLQIEATELRAALTDEQRLTAELQAQIANWREMLEAAQERERKLRRALKGILNAANYQSSKTNALNETLLNAEEVLTDNPA